ncbi:MAG: hypothetical protein HYX92_21725 [Chloroflexi bacterium]|nr:hypothetical protein [Chloroflexota bacterium]
MGTTKWISIVGYLSSLGIVLASCAPATTPVVTVAPKPGPPSPQAEAPKPATTPAAKPAGEQPKYGGTLNVGFTSDPASLDVQQETNYRTYLSMEPAYSGLLQYDPLENDKIIGDLAERWEASADGASYTFHLYPGIKAHDGQPFTSEDVKFSLDRMRDPPRGVLSPVRPLLTAIKQVDTPDKDTVRLLLNHPSPSLIAFLAIGNMVMYPKHVIEANGDMKRGAVGTGPFKLKVYNIGVSIEHVKNADYFIKGRPYLDGITFYLIRDASTRLAAFRTRKTALNTGPAGPAMADVPGLKINYRDAVVQTFPSLRHNVIRPMTTKPPFDDIRVRKALYLAVDRQAAIRVLAQDEAWVGGAVAPYASFAIPQDELLKRPGYRQPKDADIAEARKLLAEAGFPQGFKTETIGRSGSDDDLGIFLKAQLAAIGIEATVRMVDTAVMSRVQMQKSFEVLVMTLGPKTMDPDDISRYYLKGAQQNYGDFYDEEAESLFQRQARAVDPVERKKLALELQNRLLDTAGAIVVLWSKEAAAYWPELKNYKAGISAYNVNKYQDVWLNK